MLLRKGNRNGEGMEVVAGMTVGMADVEFAVAQVVAGM